MVEPLVIPFVVVRDELAPGRPEERAAVMDEDPDVSQASVLGIGGVPHELGDPRPVGLGADARDLTAAAGPVHQDQHGEAGQAAWRPELDREAVALCANIVETPSYPFFSEQGGKDDSLCW